MAIFDRIQFYAHLKREQVRQVIGDKKEGIPFLIDEKKADILILNSTKYSKIVNPILSEPFEESKNINKRVMKESLNLAKKEDFAKGKQPAIRRKSVREIQRDAFQDFEKIKAAYILERDREIKSITSNGVKYDIAVTFTSVLKIKEQFIRDVNTSTIGYVQECFHYGMIAGFDSASKEFENG